MTTPTQRIPHNPDNLTPQQVGPLHRLAYEDELEKLRGALSVDLWSEKGQWIPRFFPGQLIKVDGVYQAPNIPLDMGITYRIPLTLVDLQWRPITDPPTEADAGPDGRVLVWFRTGGAYTWPFGTPAKSPDDSSDPVSHWLPLSWLPPIPAPPDPFTLWHQTHMPSASEATARKAWEGARG
jgi:hypothetical protein